jgi:ABC-type sugar transport system ATPase subunit
MKLGVVQQIGEPQAIYDDPANLFVANFLGTPPINIFTGYIHDGGVYIGKEKIADYDKDLTEKYTANIKALQDEVEAKHVEYLEIKNTYDEKTAGMEPEKAAKAHKKLFVELQAKETEYENMVTKIADLEQSIKTKTFKVFVGIRPEGFIYDPKGVLSLMTDHVEVMGRDKTIVSVHEESVKPTIRTIVEADLKLPEGATTLKFNLKPNKFFLFDGETEERLR